MIGRTTSKEPKGEAARCQCPQYLAPVLMRQAWGPRTTGVDKLQEIDKKEANAQKAQNGLWSISIGMSIDP